MRPDTALAARHRRRQLPRLHPSLSSFLAPDLLWRWQHLMIGNLIALQFGTARNWPFGAAAAMVLLACVLIGLMIYARKSTRQDRPET